MSGLLLLVASFAWVGLPVNAVLSNYYTNLHYWFRPGEQNDFSLANPIRFDLTNLQIVFDPQLGRSAANAVAYGLVGLGLSAYAVYRNHERSTALALASVLTLSFLPVYHRV